MLNATRLEYNESGTIELNCSSSRKSIGNGAEFIVNGLTVEHISFRDNKCYNRKMEECITDHCQCFPIDKLYIYEHKDKLLATEVIVSCRMRFVDNKTSNIIKAVISLRFNGTGNYLILFMILIDSINFMTSKKSVKVILISQILQTLVRIYHAEGEKPCLRVFVIMIIARTFSLIDICILV